MNADYAKFDRLKRQSRRDVFEACAERLGANAQSVEKDFWVCRTIEALFHGLSSLSTRPKLFFKGGTSLSKGFGLIHRFSEDIDIVVSPRGLSVPADEDPFVEGLSGKQRSERAELLKQRCSGHVLGLMRERLGPLLPKCKIKKDDTDTDHSSLQVKYRSVFEPDGYLKPWVKIECGARGGTEPTVERPIVPYIQNEVAHRFDLAIAKVTLIRPERTFWEKALILHGVYSGYRDKQRPPDNLISRHYYDVAMIGGSPEGLRAMRDHALLAKVRAGKLLMFKKGWEKLEEAEPGSVRLVPQKEILAALEEDYVAMSGMMFGEPPRFDWVLEELAKLEATINQPVLV